jgi:hypothetical protein
MINIKNNYFGLFKQNFENELKFWIIILAENKNTNESKYITASWSDKDSWIQIEKPNLKSGFYNFTFYTSDNQTDITTYEKLTTEQITL